MPTNLPRGFILEFISRFFGLLAFPAVVAGVANFFAWLAVKGSLPKDDKTSVFANVFVAVWIVIAGSLLLRDWF